MAGVIDGDGIAGAPMARKDSSTMHSIDRRAALAIFAATGAATTSGLLFPGHARAYHDGRSGQGRAPLRPGTRERDRTPSSEGNVGEVEVTEDDIAVGETNAPITVIKYGSLTCPHCAAFHTNTAPGLKERYVETGTVRYVHRDFPLDRLALTAAVMLHCGDDKGAAFVFLDALYGRQRQWMQAEDPVAALHRIAAIGGIDADTYGVCLSDDRLIDGIVRQRQEAAELYEVRSTPTFLINGDRYSGNMSLAQVEAIFENMA